MALRNFRRDNSVKFISILKKSVSDCMMKTLLLDCVANKSSRRFVSYSVNPFSIQDAVINFSSEVCAVL